MNAIVKLILENLKGIEKQDLDSFVPQPVWNDEVNNIINIICLKCDRAHNNLKYLHDFRTLQGGPKNNRSFFMKTMRFYLNTNLEEIISIN